jgi:Arc/MetJ family transcription regulator
MATNLKIDAELLEEALKLSGFRTKRETVNLALQEFVARHRQMQVLKLQGSIDFDPAYDYKVQRSKP